MSAAAAPWPVLDILIFVSYVTISACVVYVFAMLYRMKTTSAQVVAVFVLWAGFIVSCGVTHLTRVVARGAPYSAALWACAAFSLTAAVLTLAGVRSLNCFLATQVALVEIFRCDGLLEFMSTFDVVAVVLDGCIASGTVAGVQEAATSGLQVLGALRPGNVVRISTQYVRVACAFDHHSANSTSVRDMVRQSFPDVQLGLEAGSSRDACMAAGTVLFIGQNVTSEWRTQELQCKIADAKLSLALTTAHDIRTPLMNFELVMDCIAAGAATAPLIEEAAVNIAAMKGTIAQTLDAGKLVSGHKLQPTLQCVQVAAFCSKLRLLCKSFEATVPIAYEVAAQGLPEHIMMDEEWMQQICVNLLSNASKYTTAGRIDFLLHAQSAAKYVVEVRDTGIGIPAAEREHIFERFTTLQTHNVESTGIGLYIVRSKCDLLAGTVTVSDNTASVTGTGSVFTVVLPLIPGINVDRPPTPKQQQQLLQQALEGDRPVALSGVSESSEAPLLTAAEQAPEQLSCLVIDDTASIRRMVSRVLERFEVHTAVNGAEGLRMMQARLYSVVFCDQSMPVMDGHMCVQRLRQWELDTGRQQRQYIVLLSANRVDAVSGFDGVTAKPVNSNQLLDIVLSRATEASATQ